MISVTVNLTPMQVWYLHAYHVPDELSLTSQMLTALQVELQRRRDFGHEAGVATTEAEAEAVDNLFDTEVS